MEKKRSHSVDDLTNEISVDSPAKGAYSGKCKKYITFLGPACIVVL